MQRQRAEAACGGMQRRHVVVCRGGMQRRCAAASRGGVRRLAEAATARIKGGVQQVEVVCRSGEVDARRSGLGLVLRN